MPQSLTLADGKPLLLSGQRAVHKVSHWKDLVAWTNSWDARDAVLYTPDATTQSYYGIDGSQRIDHIPDASGSFPMQRDAGLHASVYLLTSPLPGPLYKAADSKFGGRPAAHFDKMPNHNAFAPVLTPNQDWTNSADYFNSGNGYSVPYWVAFLGDGWDSALGGNAGGSGPTIGLGGDGLGDGIWSASVWSNNHPGTSLKSPIVTTTDQSFFVIYYNSGAADSFLEVTTRLHDGSRITQRTTGVAQLNAPYLEAFIGWVDGQAYLSALGIKTGTPSQSETDAVRSWAVPYIPVGGSGG